MVHLLFLLADNPVGPNGYIDEEKRGTLGTKVYLSKEEAEEHYNAQVDEQVRLMRLQDELDQVGEEEGQDSSDFADDTSDEVDFDGAEP